MVVMYINIKFLSYPNLSVTIIGIKLSSLPRNITMLFFWVMLPPILNLGTYQSVF